MAAPTTPASSTLPSNQSDILSAPLAGWIQTLYNFLNEAGNIDEANVDLSGSDGLVGKSTAQTITGAKTFTATTVFQKADATAAVVATFRSSTSSNGQVTINSIGDSIGSAVAGDVLIQNSQGSLFLSPNKASEKIWLSGGVWTNVGVIIDGSQNLGIRTSTFGASAAGVLAIANGTQGAALANAIQITSEDIAAGETTLSLRTEGTGTSTDGSTFLGTGTPTANRTINVKINGTLYALLASTSFS